LKIKKIGKECRHLFQKFAKWMSTSAMVENKKKIGNGCRNPFRKFLKRMSTSVSEICETDFDIHFIKKQKNRNGISKSVSQNLETDFDICFIRKQEIINEMDLNIRCTFL